MKGKEGEVKRSKNPEDQEKEGKGKQSLGKTWQQGQREGNENEYSSGKSFPEDDNDIFGTYKMTSSWESLRVF